MGLSKGKKEYVIPQVRTYTRYGMWSVVMFDYAESPISTQRRLLSLFRDFQFSISELTSNVPYAVRSTFRNDWQDINNMIIRNIQSNLHKDLCDLFEVVVCVLQPFLYICDLSKVIKKTSFLLLPMKPLCICKSRPRRCLTFIDVKKIDLSEVAH